MAEREPNEVQLHYCPDHPGPLDDARDHVCRLRPQHDVETCECDPCTEARSFDEADQ